MKKGKDEPDIFSFPPLQFRLSFFECLDDFAEIAEHEALKCDAQGRTMLL